MKHEDSKNYLDWLKKANDDELNLVSILKHRDGTPSGVCFLAQQMAEKYLKALLIYYDKPFPKIHDLLRLETLLLEKIPEIKNLHLYLGILNRYYCETRYPGDYPEFSWTDAEESYKAAKSIKEFVVSKLN